MSDEEERADKMHQALRAAIEEHAPDLESRAAILTGYIVVTEWADETGERWMGSVDMPDMTSWQVRGMLHERLYFWEVKSDEDA